MMGKKEDKTSEQCTSKQRQVRNQSDSQSLLKTVPLSIKAQLLQE